MEYSLFLAVFVASIPQQSNKWYHEREKYENALIIHNLPRYRTFGIMK